MRTTNVCLFVIACICLITYTYAAPPKWHELTADYSFDQYLQDFPGKQYHLENNILELNKRKAIFQQTLATVLAHNARGLSWQMGINDFSDLTDDEWKAQYLTGDHLPSSTIAALQSYTQEHELEQLFNGSDNNEIMVDQRVADELPETVDWRHRNFMTRRVRNQGQCGSCYSHSAISTLEMYLHAATGKEIELSTQQPVDCFENPRHCGGEGGCKGYAASMVLDDYAQNVGLTTEQAYPYESGTTKDKGECRIAGKKIVVKTKGAQKVPVNDPFETAAAVAFRGALAVSVDATHWRNYAAGIFRGEDCRRDFVKDYNMYEVTTNHAVVLIGYGKRSDTVGYWKVLNSWGSSTWGVDGHIYLERALPGQAETKYINMRPHDGVSCDGDSSDPFVVAGTCGILSNAWFVKGLEYFP